MAAPLIDVDATRCEPFCMITPRTARARAWVRWNVDNGATWDGDTMFAEHRYAPFLLSAMHEYGLTVRLDGRVADAPREATR
jgi:hypothetical protein